MRAKTALVALENLSGSRYNPGRIAIFHNGAVRRDRGLLRRVPRAGEERVMATCPECDAEIEVDEFDVDKGDILSCPECGSNLEVAGVSPVELEPAGEEDDADDDDLEGGDEEDDELDDDDEDEEGEDWEE
jgi:alpha-aminoadipate carrier protein LysW